MATGILSGEPRENTLIEVFNYQHQMIGSGITNAEGMAVIKPKGAGFYIIAEHGDDRGYLRLPRNLALPTSQFDVGGVKVNKGLKGFIYGERDVWRPGDDIFLTFVLQDTENILPDSHPVTLDFFDPRGKKVASRSNSKPVGDLYTFQLQTDESAPTGSWRAVAKVGGEYFSKKIKVETIMPNRLKVELKPAEHPIHASGAPIRTELFAQWLNGAAAAKLKADTELKLSPVKTTFKGWSQYIFDDPAANFEKYKQKVFDSNLDETGRAAFELNLPRIQAPGKLRATFVTRVFEQSGNFSTSIQSEEVFPFENWVGINIPKGEGYGNALARDKEHTVHLQTINSDAETVANRKLKIDVYHIGWRWWWDQSEEDLANFIRGNNAEHLVDTDIITDDKGHATWTLKKNRYDWGRHLIRVCDVESNHCSGKEVYLGWSWQNQVNPDSATQLTLGTDKERYNVGDTAVIKIPKLAQGKILYSIENGSRVLEQKWLDLKPGATSFSLPVTEEMTPNVYVNVVLLLPHLDRETDAPIRLYGITPLLVDDPGTHLTPVITSPDTVRPSSSFDITVTEKNNKKMSYTLAVVDEGLLGITNYRTPDPHDKFYRRESLGVLTWDMFDGVIGAYGASLERLLRIGGGSDGKKGDKKNQRRFPPVVKFAGAFTIEAGQSRTHTIQLPQYMGAIRLMVVAADSGAYGKAEQTVIVTQPLTLLATLPRVIGPNEKVALPVNVFVSNKTIKDVTIEVEASDIFSIKDTSKKITFDGPGDKIALMELAVKDGVGMGAVTVVATSGDEKAEQTIHIESRSPNLLTTVTKSKFLQPGENWRPDLLPHGMPNTNTTTVAVSSFPPLNLDNRLGYLLRYPHGCVEQTTSTIFPQIWLKYLTNLSRQQQDEIQDNVNAAIDKLMGFQNISGSFSYWPTGSYVNEWATIYATHFLVEARDMGYAVPKTMIEEALAYLKNNTSGRDKPSTYSRLVSAYRLYVLSIAGSSDMAAMNRLRESLLQDYHVSNNDTVAQWLLSMAYQSLGLSDVANELLAHAGKQVLEYRFSEYTYGSTLRDIAILLMTYTNTGHQDLAWDEASEIARMLSQDRWYSTQSTAWALLALSKYATAFNGKGSNQFSISENADADNADNYAWQAINSVAPIYQQKIISKVLSDNALIIRNDSDHPLYAEISNTGIPAQGDEKESNKGLSLNIEFTDLSGAPLDIKALPQGQDFIAEVHIETDNTRQSYKIEDIAMNMIMASGWQIRNERLEGSKMPEGLDYQDIRDDRILSYFSLWKDHKWYYRYTDKTRNSQTISILLNASFSGRYYLPGWEVKSMYDEDIYARSVGQWVEVISEIQQKTEQASNQEQQN